MSHRLRIDRDVITLSKNAVVFSENYDVTHIKRSN